MKDFTCRPFVSELLQHQFIVQTECLTSQVTQYDFHNRRRPRRIMFLGVPINQSINLRLLVACQNASQQLTTVIHVALVQESCA